MEWSFHFKMQFVLLRIFKSEILETDDPTIFAEVRNQ